MQRSKKTVRASVIVPAYKEGANVRPLVTRLFAALDSRKTSQFNKDNVECIFVDDNSRDGSEDEVHRLANEGYPVRIIVRTTERGLSSAVLRGFAEANGDLLLCMDADLQHPPEKVPELLEALDADSTEFVIGTRYGEGVEIDKDWPLHRQIISKTARLMARPLTPLSDPMTGFFGIRKDVLARGQNINNVGFKICLELYAKCRCRRFAEVPFSFGVRVHGESKLTGAVIVKYIQQLKELYNDQMPWFLPALFVFLLVAVFIFFYLAKKVLMG